MNSSLLPNDIQDIDGLELKEQVKVIKEYIEYMREQLQWFSGVTNKAEEGFVQSVTTYYGVSTSPSVAPSEWSTEPPNVQEGEYLWQYTKTTRSGTVTRSEPVCISASVSGGGGEDAALIYIHSSNGTILRAGNTGTILTVTVYYGSDAIRNITNLRTAFGSDASIAWYVREYGESTYDLIPSTDPRISGSGFTLSLTASDVDTKATYNCRLELGGGATRSQASITITDVEDGYTSTLSKESISWNGNDTSLGSNKSVSFTVSAFSGSGTVPFTIGTPVVSDATNASASVSGSTVTVSVAAAASLSGTVTLPINITDGPTLHKTFSYFVVLKGSQGIQGDKGDQGIQGPTGPNGQTTYVHIKYSSIPNPTTAADISDVPDEYIGICTNYTQADPTDPAAYVPWTRFKGEDGAQGIPGATGEDGTTYYVHFAYGTSDTGADFSVTPFEGATYIGVCTDTNIDDPITPASYAWSLTKGERGPQGIQGAQGEQGIPGPQGPAGTSSYIHIKYSAYASPTDAQMTETPDEYIGICTDSNPTDPTTASSYTWSKFQGEDGPQGIQGPTGEDGETYYVHFAYGTSDSGADFSVIPFEGATYIGVCTDTNIDDPLTPSSYAWSLTKGETGEEGERGGRFLKVTTAPSSYTTPVGGFTPSYRIALSTVKTQSGSSDVLVGDIIEYSYYHYPVGYVDASYVYTTARQSIRGATGAAGINAATLFLYQRAASAPSGPSSTLTYTFADKTITGSLGNWQTAVPSGSNPLYVTIATASSNAATDTIDPADWTTPSILAQDGSTGIGISSVTELYFSKANTTAPSAPTSTVTTNDPATQNTWNKALPTFSASYPHYFTCSEVLYTDGSRNWTSPVYAGALTTANQTAAAANTTANEASATANTAKDTADAAAATAATAESTATEALNKHGFCSCTTAAGTAAKTASLSDFQLKTGSTVHVTFSNANTVANATLNINSTGAKPIIWNGASLTATESPWAAGECVSFVYDGTNWVISGQSNITADNIVAGSIAADRIKANVISAVNGGTGSIAADKITATVIDAVNNGTGTINADKINAAGLTIGQSQVTGLSTALDGKEDVVAGTTATYDTDQEPYLLRTSGKAILGQESLDQIIGASVAWNQLVVNGDFSDGKNSWTANPWTVTDGVATVSAASGSTSTGIMSQAISFIAGRRYLLAFDVKQDQTTTNDFRVAQYSSSVGSGLIISSILSGVAVNTWTRKEAIFTATASAGSYTRGLRFAWTSSSPLQGGETVHLKNIQVYDLTLMFGTGIAEYIYNLEQATEGAGPAKLREWGFLSNQYYATDTGTIKNVEGLTAHVTKDANDNIMGRYPLDSALTLRGVPTLVNNELTYDGDTYEPDGTVTRKYGYVDLGSLEWSYNSTYSYFSVSLPSFKTQTANGILPNIICRKYSTYYNNSISGSGNNPDKTIASRNASTTLYVKDSAYSTAAAFITAVTGTYLVYELATQSTESAAPYQQIQSADEDGTESFETTSIVPVGHNTRYPTNVRATLTPVDTTDAAKTATSYITNIDSGGITVTGNDASSSVQIADTVRVIKDSTHFTEMTSSTFNIHAGSETIPVSRFGHQVQSSGHVLDYIAFPNNEATKSVVLLEKVTTPDTTQYGLLKLHDGEGNPLVELSHSTLEGGFVNVYDGETSDFMAGLGKLSYTNSYGTLIDKEPTLLFRDDNGTSKSFYSLHRAYINDGTYAGFVVHGNTPNHGIRVDYLTSGRINFYADTSSIGYATITSSDKRMKTDIEPIDERYKRAVESVELKNFNYDFTDATRAGANLLRRFGAIAQDVIKALEDEDLDYRKSELVETLEDNNSEYYTINYIPFLLARLAADEDRIQELETRLEALERRYT